ncbi:MAG: flavin reductase family protein [Muribaculaceae bacterium]|nr:flavin reductase family protein [Muribaculaceae bacterium]
MPKRNWRPGTMVYPLPAVLVSCGTSPETYNMLTVAWTGTICSDPAMCYISVRRERHSYDLIADAMEFTINLTTTEMAHAVDWAGVRSGRDFDKWKETGLTPVKGKKVSTPYIEQSPLSIECRVKDIIHLGSHDMFIAEVVNVIADERFIDSETDAFDLSSSSPLVYCHGAYFGLGEHIGKFGWTVEKKKKSK